MTHKESPALHLISLRDILQRPDAHAGWLYLKPGPWTLDSFGFFYEADPDLAPQDEAAVRMGFEAEGWVVTLSSDDIEDVVANLGDQIEEPAEAELLQAVRYFYDHDAFLEWPA